MSIYAVDKLMAETRRLAAEYHQQTGQVLPVSSELARYDVARLLKFTEPSEPETGVDFIGAGSWEGQKIQVKARVLFDNSKSRQRVGQLNLDSAWDQIALVLMTPTYDPDEIYMLDRDTFLAEVGGKENPKRKSRGALSVAKFKAIGKRVWSVEFGVEPE